MTQSFPQGETSPTVGLPGNWEHRFRSVNGIRLHCVEAGEGPAVVLLHGFPEFWYSWRHQIRALSEAGFRAIAPDLRGYNESDRPPDVSSYTMPTLIDDVADLIQQVSDGPAFLVGHDWGGVIAWLVAAMCPELVRRLAILNAPHPSAYREELRHNPGQWFRSSYMMFFQIPGLPEQVLRARDFALLERTWRRHPEAFTPRDIAEYKKALGRPDGLRGPLHYYRAALRHPAFDWHRAPSVKAPTLLIWGERDPYLSPSIPDRVRPIVADLRIDRIPDAGHWVQNEAPDRVNRALLTFFDKPGPVACMPGSG